MNIGFIVILVVILVETTFLCLAHFLKPRPHRQITGRRKLYVDSSALMDGRILKVAESGFLSDNLIIPRSAIREMQTLADGKDPEKRARARFGINLVNDLERVVYCNTEILQDPLDHTPVDERLLELAKENHGAIITNDYNLEKVAETEGIDVLNVNALATLLRPEYLPGEKLNLRVQNEGNNPKQGVGYLPDGTMVIVENGQKFVGKDIEVSFARYIQTPTGRMLFAKLSPNNQKTDRGAKSSSKAKKRSR